MKRETKILRYKEIKSKLTPWLENKIERARSLSKHYASRASRFGAPAGVALLLFIVLYSLFQPKDRFQQAKERILKNPQDFEAHLILAEEFLKNNQLEEAEKELLAAQQIQSNNPQYSLAKPDPALQDNLAIKQTQVLGLSSKLNDLWSQWRSENPEEIKKEIQKWEKIVEETPTYRDGWLRLTLDYYKLGEIEKAKENLNHALELDPNFETTKELEKLLK